MTTTVSNHAYSGETLLLDGRRYQQCTFTKCTLVFAGREGFALDTCEFVESSLAVGEAASFVLAVLSRLGQVGAFKDTIGAILDEVRKGEFTLTDQVVVPQ